MNRSVSAILASIALCTRANAGGIYSPDESQFAFEVDATDGALPRGKAFSFNTFQSLLGTVRAVDNPTGARHLETLARIDDRTRRMATLDGEQLAGLSADLLRLRRYEEAINLLHPLSRDRRRSGFVIWSHLTRAHLARNELNEAIDAQTTAIYDYPFPGTFARLTAPELAWLRTVEKDYFLPLLRARRAEGTSSNVRDSLDPLFRYPPVEKGKPGEPIPFVESRNPEPDFDPKARDALPPDAIAIVQQLLLWMPDDSRLLWLLGELYRSRGELETAEAIFDECVREPRNYSSPALMEHRQGLRTILEVRRSDEAARVAAEVEKVRNRKIAVGLGVGTLVFFLLRYQYRELVRRWNRRRARRNAAS